MDDFSLFTKKDPDHLIHDDYLATERHKRKIRRARVVGVILAICLARFLWGW